MPELGNSEELKNKLLFSVVVVSIEAEVFCTLVQHFGYINGFLGDIHIYILDLKLNYVI